MASNAITVNLNATLAISITLVSSINKLTNCSLKIIANKQKVPIIIIEVTKVNLNPSLTLLYFFA